MLMATTPTPWPTRAIYRSGPWRQHHGRSFCGKPATWTAWYSAVWGWVVAIEVEGNTGIVHDGPFRSRASAEQHAAEAAARSIRRWERAEWLAGGA
jgi:hypothetical protein